MNAPAAPAAPVDAANPLLADWTGPYGMAPFAEVRAEQFAPAFEVAMSRHLAEIDAIGGACGAPTFENTVAALDRSGRLFDRIGGLFYNLTSSETSPALQAVERDMAPLLAAHDSRIYMHAGVFARLDALHAQRDALTLSSEQRRVLERFHIDYVRAGARMSGASQQRYAEVMQRLAELTTGFGQNVLADESGFRLVLKGEADLAGLPPFVCAALRQAALDNGIDDGGSLVTLSRSNIVPFLTFSERRDLREAAWRAWTARGEHAGPTDNRGVAAEILRLRHEQAQLHGYASFADFALSDTMAGSQAAVITLLERVWQPARARALEERAALEALALSRGEPVQIEPWDWRFYAEKVRQVRFDLDEAEVKPYFPLERMVEAVFDCATRLFGLVFVPRPEIRVYHPDVRVYEVQRAGGETIGIFLHDNFARPTKRSGAWMSAYRMQSRNGGHNPGRVLPIIVNNNNFAKGAAGEPTLLSFDDARTLFHEFGHGLQLMLTQIDDLGVSGISGVEWDAVELPSQFMENFCWEWEVVKRMTSHIETGAALPRALFDRMLAAKNFHSGLGTLRQVELSLIDMRLHTEPDAQARVSEIVDAVRADVAVLLLPAFARALNTFTHIFDGGYAAGYYSYKWAEVLSADAWSAFEEAPDVLDVGTGRRYRQAVLETGGSRSTLESFKAFRGREPTIDALLRHQGLG